MSRLWQMFQPQTDDMYDGYDPQVGAVVEKFRRLANMDPNERMYSAPQDRDLTPQEVATMHGALGLPSERLQGEIRQIMSNQDREWGKQIKADGQRWGPTNINNYWGEKYESGRGPDRSKGMLKLPDGDQLTATLSKYGTQMSPELAAYASQRDRLWGDLGMQKGGLPSQFSPRGEAPAGYDAEGPTGQWKGGATFTPYQGKGGQSGVSRYQWGSKPAETSVNGRLLPPGGLQERSGAQYDMRGFKDTPSDAIPSWQQQYYPKGPYGNLKRTGIDPSYVPEMSDLAPGLPGSSWRGAPYPGKSGLDVNPQTGRKFDEGILNPMLKVAPMPGVYEKHDVRGRVIEQAPKVGPMDWGDLYTTPTYSNPAPKKFDPFGVDTKGWQPGRDTRMSFPNMFDGLAMFGFGGW